MGVSVVCSQRFCCRLCRNFSVSAAVVAPDLREPEVATVEEDEGGEEDALDEPLLLPDGEV